MTRHDVGGVNICSYQPNLRCMQAASTHLNFKQTPAMLKLFLSKLKLGATYSLTNISLKASLDIFFNKKHDPSAGEPSFFRSSSMNIHSLHGKY